MKERNKQTEWKEEDGRVAQRDTVRRQQWGVVTVIQEQTAKLQCLVEGITAQLYITHLYITHVPWFRIYTG